MAYIIAKINIKTVLQKPTRINLNLQQFILQKQTWTNLTQHNTIFKIYQKIYFPKRSKFPLHTHYYTLRNLLSPLRKYSSFASIFNKIPLIVSPTFHIFLEATRTSNKAHYPSDFLRDKARTSHERKPEGTRTRGWTEAVSTRHGPIEIDGGGRQRGGGARSSWFTCMPHPRLTWGSPGRVATPAAAAPPPRHAAFSLTPALLSKVSGEVVRAELP